MSTNIEFNSISPEGYAVGAFKDKQIYAFGILPGETATGEVVNKKKKYYLRVEEIIKPSSERIPPKESHYLSCSPFQIANYEFQIQLKSEMMRKSFEEENVEVGSWKDFVCPKDHWGYRTKIEYSFVSDENGLNFCFFERLKKFKRIKLEPTCLLMSEQTNAIALRILKKLNEYRYTEFDMKSLTLRESKTNGAVMAVLLFKKEHSEFEMEIDWDGGMLTAFSDPRSPASRIDLIYWKKEKDYLEEEVLGKRFRYGVESFFQNNLEMYENALHVIRDALLGIKTSGQGQNFKILDLYSGIGSIGLSLCDLVNEVTGVEIIPEAIEFANLNAELNQIKNYKAILSPSEKINPETFEGKDIVILDPARPGLHQKVIDMLNNAKPKWIIYLSCNHITQSRDIASLQENYIVESLQGYDFYPNTYHLESLAILKLK